MAEPTEAPLESKPAPIDPTRSKIAELCRAAADVLAEDMAERSAFDNHPHPDAAFGFLETLDGVARWGINAQTWDDAMLANYVGSADSIAFAVRIGADAYYEVLKERMSKEEFPESDPDTCIFRELEKWRDCMTNVAPDDAVGRMTCFWNFTVLNSCRRCLRA